jgi:hypothetical protein
MAMLAQFDYALHPQHHWQRRRNQEEIVEVPVPER